MFLNDAYLGGFIFNSPDTIAPQRTLQNPCLLSHGLSIQCGLYPFFFYKNTTCVSNHKIVKCAIKKKELNRAVEMVVIP